MFFGSHMFSSCPRCKCVRTYLHRGRDVSMCGHIYIADTMKTCAIQKTSNTYTNQNNTDKNNEEKTKIFQSSPPSIDLVSPKICHKKLPKILQTWHCV